MATIKELIKKARRIFKSPGLDILIAPTPESIGKLVVITPAKIGTAVERNRIRRRIKALFREEKLLTRGFDYVIIVKKEGIGIEYSMLKKIILNALLNKTN